MTLHSKTHELPQSFHGCRPKHYCASQYSSTAPGKAWYHRGHCLCVAIPVAQPTIRDRAPDTRQNYEASSFRYRLGLNPLVTFLPLAVADYICATVEGNVVSNTMMRRKFFILAFEFQQTDAFWKDCMYLGMIYTHYANTCSPLIAIWYRDESNYFPNPVTYQLPITSMQSNT